MPKTKEEMREYHREWSKKNWEKRKASYYKWKEKNRDKVKEIDNRCYANTKSKDKAQRMLQAAKYRAKKYNLPFNITKIDIVIPEYCPVFPWIKLDGLTNDTRPELDRIVPELGYIKGNVAVISGRANRIKWNATADELGRIHAYVVNNVIPPSV